MSLQIWLPLNNDLTNYGLAGEYKFTIPATGIVFSNGGKLGNKCAIFSAMSGSGIYSADNGFMKTYVNHISSSICCWFKTTTKNTNLIHLSYGLGLLISSDGKPYLRQYRSGSTISTSATKNCCDDIWHHVAATYDATLNITKIYVDGVLEGQTNYSYNNDTYASSWANGLFIGRNPNDSTQNSYYYYQGSMNDVRIYDHCLSAAEVKEISKGLLLHYKLNKHDRYVNMFTNTNGYYGTKNWTSTTAVSDDVPSGVDGLYKSFGPGNMTSEYTIFDPTISYHFEVWLKTSGPNSATTYTYPSLFPYDIDKKFIDYYKSEAGFNKVTATKLVKDLKPGDTVIYCEDLSQWSTSTTNHYYRIAIFGYKDSTGYVYPDLKYTQNAPSFGSQTDKSNINKTNNTVTLKAAYNGPLAPAGTTVCQSTEGSTYFYPIGSVKTSDIQEWKKYSGTIAANQTRLGAAKYVRYYSYSNSYDTGIVLSPLLPEITTEYDCSGYCYNGTKNGPITEDKTSPRFGSALQFKPTSYIGIDPAPIQNGMTEFTIAWWMKINTLTDNECIYNGRTTTGGPIAIFSIGGIMRFDDGAQHGSLYTFPKSKWEHYAITWTTSKIKVYVNGELVKNINSTQFTTAGTKATIGASSVNTTTGNGNTLDGSLSDFRIYGTALSDTDIMDLYSTGAMIDKSGNVYCFEFDERMI